MTKVFPVQNDTISNQPLEEPAFLDDDREKTKS